MKIAVTGASGRAGSAITAELARRGHSVTAIARNPDRIAKLANVTAVAGDANDRAGLAKLWAGHDAAVSSIHFVASDVETLIGAARDSAVPRYLVVGGAGSLEVAPGVRLVATPNFPAQYRAEAEKGTAFLDRLQREKELNWTFLSPSALFEPGSRTGKFRGMTSFWSIRRAKAGSRSRTLRSPWPTRSSVRPMSASALPSVIKATDRFACARAWPVVTAGQANIVCRNRPLYKRRARGNFPLPRGRKGAAPSGERWAGLGKVEELSTD